MRLFAFLLLFSASISPTLAQKLAITLDGDTVELKDNGTWEYTTKHSSQSNLEELPINETKFVKPAAATKFLTGGKGIYEIWYDPKVWTKVSNKKYNEDAELSLEMNSKLAYALVIYEELEIPVETLLNVAYENTQGTVTSMKVVKKEYRQVNGLKVALMQMEGEVDGLKVTYFSYYYSNSNGTWQFHTFTMTSFFKQYKKAMEDLLNGFIIK